MSSVKSRKRAHTHLAVCAHLVQRTSTNSLPYHGAHGNGYEATRTNAWGEMASTAVSERVQGQVSSSNQEPPAFSAGECQ
jgi:hypothetical protein